MILSFLIVISDMGSGRQEWPSEHIINFQARLTLICRNQTLSFQTKYTQNGSPHTAKISEGRECNLFDAIHIVLLPLEATIPFPKTGVEGGAATITPRAGQKHNEKAAPAP